MANVRKAIRNLAACAVSTLALAIVSEAMGIDLSGLMNGVFVLASFATLLELFGVDTKLS